MHFTAARSIRLVARGGPGLACDEDGVTLGAVSLVALSKAKGLSGRCVVRSIEELREILQLAYGAQQLETVRRCRRRLIRIAAHLEAGDLPLAGLEAVLIGLPELPPQALEKLAGIADAEKAGTAWQDQPRIPAGETGGGQWTTGGAGGAGGHADQSSEGDHAAQPTGDAKPQLNDGVFRPAQDSPVLMTTGGGDDEEPRDGIGGNRPPGDPTSLEDVFPGLRDMPGLAIPLAPIDGFLGIGAAGDEANLSGTLLEYNKLVAQIRSVDPMWVDQELLPPGGVAGLSWQARTTLIDSLRIQRAAVYYNIRGDAGPLQVETLRFLQDAVDNAYEQAKQKYGGGSLPVRLSQSEAIGNFVDARVRENLRDFYNEWGIPYGSSRNVTVNNRDPSGLDQSYRVPDARVGNVSFDWTLSPKTISTPQIRGFFRADSEPIAVIIVRPSQLGQGNTYLIPRPSQVRKRYQMSRNPRPRIPQGISELFDYVGAMMLNSPTFIDEMGYFPNRNIETTFHALNEGLALITSEIGDERYERLLSLSKQMRAYFEADPEDKTGEAIKGRDLILDMRDILRGVSSGQVS